MEVTLLSVSTVGGLPAVVLSTEARRFIVDAGEGTQRLCIEHKVRLVKVDAIFLTRLSPETNSGLPGMCLTAIDSGKLELDLVGPTGTRAFYHSTRYWMRRPQFNIRIEDALAGPDRASASGEDVDEKVWGALGEPLLQWPDLHVRWRCYDSNSSNDNNSSSNCTHVAYLFNSPVQPGKFDVAAAHALGIPPGPLFAKVSIRHNAVQCSAVQCSAVR